VLGAFDEALDDDLRALGRGQGKGGRNPILVDPGWITATKAETDFRDGLENPLRLLV